MVSLLTWLLRVYEVFAFRPQLGETTGTTVQDMQLQALWRRQQQAPAT